MSYTAPALEWPDDPARREPLVIWIVFIGFAFFLVPYYAAYCSAIGGSLDVDLTWHGLKLTCRR